MTNLIFGYSRFVVGIINQLFLVPVYLVYVSTEVYGAWLASGNLIVILTVFDIGFHLVVVQKLATAYTKENSKTFARSAGAAFVLSVVALMLVVTTTLVLSRWIPGWIRTPAYEQSGLRAAIELAGIAAGIRIVALVFWAILQAWQLARPSEGGLLVSAVLGVITVLWSLHYGKGVVSFAIGDFVAATTAFMLLGSAVARTWLQRRMEFPRWRFSDTQELLRESWVVVASRFGVTLANSGQPVIVSACLGPYAAAVLGLTSRTFVGCQTLLQPLAGSTFAGIAHLAGSSPCRVKRVLQELFSFVWLAAALVFGTTLALNGSFGQLWVGARRFGDVHLTVALCLATLLLTIINIIGMIVTALGDVRRPALCSAAEALVRLPLTIILVVAVGMIGAPIATCVAGCLVSLWYVVRRLAAVLQTSLHETLGTICCSAPSLGVTVILGTLISQMMPPAPTWAAFAMEALAAGAIMVTSVLLTSRFARQKLAEVKPILWRLRASTR